MALHQLSPTPQARARVITTDILIWNGVAVLVSYEPDWFGLAAAGSDEPYAHLELLVLSPQGAPLPVTDTGYWSEFLGCGEAEAVGGPSVLVTALLDEMSHTTSWRIARARWELLAASA